MRFSGLATTVLLSLFSTACGDDTGASDGHSADAGSGGQGSTDAGAGTGGDSPGSDCIPASADQLVGRWFVAVQLPIESNGSPSPPLVFWLEVDEELDFSAQFLDANDWSTPVGDALHGTDIGIGSRALIDLPRTALPGDANPSLYGVPFELELHLEGRLCIDNALAGLNVGEICGMGSGTMDIGGAELDLTGATFRTHALYPSAPIPEKVRVDCDGRAATTP